MARSWIVAHVKMCHYYNTIFDSNSSVTGFYQVVPQWMFQVEDNTFYFCSLLVSFTTALSYFICWFFIAHVKQTPFNITLLVIHVQNLCLVEWSITGTQYVKEARSWCEHFYCHSLKSNHLRKFYLFHQSFIYVKIHVNKLFLLMIFLLFLIS